MTAAPALTAVLLAALFAFGAMFARASYWRCIASVSAADLDRTVSQRLAAARSARHWRDASIGFAWIAGICVTTALVFIIAARRGLL